MSGRHQLDLEQSELCETQPTFFKFRFDALPVTYAAARTQQAAEKPQTGEFMPKAMNCRYRCPAAMADFSTARQKVCVMLARKSFRSR
jgi:hypothetical protein